MQIKQYSKEYEKDYDKFTRSKSSILFFYSIKYINFLCELLPAKNETLLAYKDNQIVGILPLLSKNGSYGKVLNSLPFYGSNGFIISDDKESYNLLLNYYNSIAEDDNIFSSTVIENPLVKYDRQEENIIHNFKDYRIGQITEFSNVTSENLMDIFHYKTRNMIRKAFKSNIEISIYNDSFDFLLKVHQENMYEVGGKAKSKIFFDLLQKYFEPYKDYNIYVAKKDSVIVSALLVFYFNETVEYYTPVVKVEYRNLQPLSAVIYTAMQDAIDNGYKNWNWGGTWATQDGVYRFKKRWGTTDIRYNYYTQFNIEKEKISKDILLKEYEYFYTIPFNELEN